MTTIWKYDVDLTRGLLLIPEHSRILSFQIQNGHRCVWAAVNTEARLVSRRIVIYGTGHELPDDPGVYIGSAQQGPFVWHAFDEGDK